MLLMPSTKTHPFSADQGKGMFLMGQVYGNDGDPIVKADISSIAAYFYNISDEDSVTQIGSTATLTVNSVVFDTWQEDGRWDEDATGYNFRYDVPATYTGTACKMRVEIVFNPASGEDFAVNWEGTVRRMRSVT